MNNAVVVLCIFPLDTMFNSPPFYDDDVMATYEMVKEADLEVRDQYMSFSHLLFIPDGQWSSQTRYFSTDEQVSKKAQEQRVESEQFKSLI